MMNNKKVLECSSKGDKRFSAMYAKVDVFSVIDSIENHYQRSKRDAKGNPVKKGQPVDHFVLNNRKFPAAMLTDLYRLLWIKYLDKNPELVEYARQFDEFTDMFRGKNTVNCQADVIRAYITDRKQLIKSASGLAKRLRQTNNRTEEMDQAAKDITYALETGCLDVADLLAELSEESLLKLKSFIMLFS